MRKNMEFKVRYWLGDTGYRKAVIGTYYCSSEEDIKDQALCINTKEGQFVIDTRSVIKLLKKHGRI